MLKSKGIKKRKKIISKLKMIKKMYVLIKILLEDY